MNDHRNQQMGSSASNSPNRTDLTLAPLLRSSINKYPVVRQQKMQWKILAKAVSAIFICEMRAAVRSLARNIRSIGNLNDKVQNQKQTVYLTHVKWVSGKEQLTKYFSRYGKIKDVSLFFDSETGLHRGFASVTFDHPDSAAAAIQNRPHVIDGDIVDVEAYMPIKKPSTDFKKIKMRTLHQVSRMSKVVTDRLFVTNLHWITGKDQLTKYFSKFAPVKRVHIPTRAGGFNAPDAFVIFENAEDVTKILNMKKAHKLDNRIIRIDSNQ
ncbi:RRM domain-containing protein [Aphelenchoides bicaudatus]|nr:RRM domain-containing protein [Aphelenchoides bicaudatus]